MKINVVYHGSPKGDIKELTSRASTHGLDCIYATDNLVIAMMFMSRGNGDLDTVKLYSDGMPILVERREGVLEKLYNKDGYIYELPGDTFHHQDFLWTPEVISMEKTIKPINIIYYDNILEVLENMAKDGKLKIYKYPDRPEYVPNDNRDLIDKYISFENRGIKGSISQLLKIYPEFEEEVREKISSKSIVR